ncbi:sulfoquinovosidase-like [Physella acuta]|uniref:sulfoquinovosidase-like n=1 Tax=Physella acuta TaxID=109671 RepID=UPI0027DB09B5|nr:sulfoquinovosidase-like [Physella acuta]
MDCLTPCLTLGVPVSTRFFILGKTGSLYFNKAGSLLDAVTELTSFLGRMPELPEWLLGGAVLGVQGGTDTMLSRYRQAKAFDIPVAGIWIQDWSGKVDMEFGQRVNWDWRWDPRWYPDLDKVIKNLKQDGVRVLAYINPYLRQNGDMFKEAEALGYLVRNGTGDVYLQRSVTLMFGSVDLTNPSAYSWYKNIIKTNLIGLGMGGWMADFGEYLPVDAVLHDGRSGLEGHNEWPVLWAKLNREALEETGQLGEIVFFTRAGFSGTSKFTTLVWNGDQNVDFSPADGVRSSVYGTLSLAVSGVGLSHFDIGGYTTLADLGLTRSGELLLRSAEMAVFTPVFRTHEGNQPKANAQWYNNNTISSFARLAKQFALLADYRKFVVQQVSRAGVPAQLPVSVVYEGSPSPYSQFLFGSDLLVAPVCQENVQDLWVSLPVSRGYDWVHLWTRTSYTGGQTILVPVPLGQPAVFYRSDSAFRQVFDSLTTTTHTKRLAPELGFLPSPGRKWRHS